MCSIIGLAGTDDKPSTFDPHKGFGCQFDCQPIGSARKKVRFSREVAAFRSKCWFSPHPVQLSEYPLTFAATPKCDGLRRGIAWSNHCDSPTGIDLDFKNPPIGPDKFRQYLS